MCTLEIEASCARKTRMHLDRAVVGPVALTAHTPTALNVHRHPSRSTSGVIRARAWTTSHTATARDRVEGAHARSTQILQRAGHT